MEEEGINHKRKAVVRAISSEKDMKSANEVLFAQVSLLFPPFPVLGRANYLPSQPRLVDLSDGLTRVQCRTQAQAGTLGTVLL